MPSKRSIAFVANTSWSVYKFRLYLIEKLIAHGFSVYVLAPRDPYTERFEAISGLTYIELKHYRSKSISLLQNFRLIKELAAHYRHIRPEIIFHYTIKANIFGSIAAARAGIPCVSVVTGLGYAFLGQNWLQASVQILYRKALQKNLEVWFLNPDDREVFLTKKIVGKEKSFLLPGEGIDTHAFYPAPYENGKKEIVFLLIGRIIKHKGIYEFAKAAELLQQKGLAVKLQLLGFFDERNPVAISRAQVAEWERRNIINYLGHTDEVIPFIEKADCIVLPSYREGLPLSLLEGASMCKALIATDVAGCRELIRNGVNGYLCKKKDWADLAGKMEKYYQLPAAEKRQMGIEGRNWILERFNRDRIVDIYLDKINAFLKNGHEH